jgi:hypothetical protein
MTTRQRRDGYFAKSSHQPKERAQLVDEQLGLLEAAKWPRRSSSFQERMSRKRFAAQRRDGRWSSWGKIEQPVGTATESVVSPEIHSLTWLMLSQ